MAVIQSLGFDLLVAQYEEQYFIEHILFLVRIFSDVRLIKIENDLYKK